MPRQQPPPDPSKGPVEAFAYELYERRKQAGSPPYRDMANKAFVSHTSLSRAAQGHKLPTWEVALAYLKACDVTESDILAIYGRWEIARIEAAQLKASAPADGIAHAPRSTLGPVPEPEPADQVPPAGDDTRRREDAFGPLPAGSASSTDATVGPAMGGGVSSDAAVISGGVGSSVSQGVVLKHVGGRVHVSAGRGHGGSRRRQPAPAPNVRLWMTLIIILLLVAAVVVFSP